MHHALVVDDDPGIRQMVALALETEGYEVVMAANGAEALDEIGHNQPSVMLLDLQMPVLDGRQVVEELRAQGRWVPTVLMTAATAALQRCRELGADACLPKPFSIDQLFEAVDRVCRL